MTTERVLITGGASGLGEALVRNYSARGAKVCFGDINTGAGQALEAELREKGQDVKFCELDIASEESVIKATSWMSEEWGGVDGLINNAGISTAGAIDECTPEAWDRQIEINLKGAVRCVRNVVPMMKAQGSGRIINIASMSAVLHLPNMAAYNVSKAGILALSETLLFELEDFGIHTHVAMPTFFRSNLAQTANISDPNLAAINKRLVERAYLSADNVAERILAGVDAGRFHIFISKKSKRAWLFKRYLPFGTFKSMIKKQIAAIENRMETPKE